MYCIASTIIGYTDACVFCTVVCKCIHSLISCTVISCCTTVLFFESPDYTLVECTQEPGYLSLTPSSRRKFNITVLKVYVGEPGVYGGEPECMEGVWRVYGGELECMEGVRR